MTTRIMTALACLLFVSATAGAQEPPQAQTATTTAAQAKIIRERARPAYLKAWEFMKAEAWPSAAQSFQEAIGQDPEFEDAYYGLGLASIRMRKYPEALSAYQKSRDLYQASAVRHFADRQEAQAYGRERLRNLDEVIKQFQLTQSSDPRTVDRLRQLEDQRRQLQEYFQRGGSNISADQAVPVFVRIALGSAYFRLEQWADAEREYKAAVANDPKSGEAFSNLAVVYMQTGRYAEADAAVKSAEKAGFKVHPQLKLDIKAKLQ